MLRRNNVAVFLCVKRCRTIPYQEKARSGTFGISDVFYRDLIHLTIDVDNNIINRHNAIAVAESRQGLKKAHVMRSAAVRIVRAEGLKAPN
jgi:hypothetical protein